MSLPADIIDVIASTRDLRLRRIIAITSRRTAKVLKKIECNPFIAASKGDTFSLEHAAVVFGAPSGMYVLRKFFHQVLFFKDGSEYFFKAAKKPEVVDWMIERKLISRKMYDSYIKSGRLHGKPHEYLMRAKNRVELVKVLSWYYTRNFTIDLIKTMDDVRALLRYGRIKKGAGHMGFPEVYCLTRTPYDMEGLYRARFLTDDLSPKLIRGVVSKGQELLDKVVGVYLAYRYAVENSTTKLLTEAPRIKYLTKRELFKLIEEQKIELLSV